MLTPNTAKLTTRKWSPDAERRRRMDAGMLNNTPSPCVMALAISSFREHSIFFPHFQKD
ncbi:hypothetical protein B4168_1448 [Anoxybacillus flavithermus]|nr:hypothetical protein B4168_1448 [Anoxybacillus flavithermus]